MSPSDEPNLRKLISECAHELQQPLCAVKGNIELIRDYYGDRLPPQATEMLHAAIRMSHRMSDVIDGMLAAVSDPDPTNRLGTMAQGKPSRRHE